MEKETNLKHYRQEVIKAMSSCEDYVDALNKKFGFIKKNHWNEKITDYEKKVAFVDFLLEEYEPRFEITELEKFILENVDGTTITRHGANVVIEGYQYYHVQDGDKQKLESEKYTLKHLTSYFENAYFDGLEDDKTYYIDKILERYEVVEFD